MANSLSDLMNAIREQPQSLGTHSAEFFSQLLNAVQEAIIAVDQSEHIIFWNGAATSISG
jgi:PAS domain-containing protein